MNYKYTLHYGSNRSCALTSSYLRQRHSVLALPLRYVIQGFSSERHSVLASSAVMLAPVRLYLLGAPVAELEDVRTLLQHVVARVCGVEAAYVQVPHLSGPVCYNSEWNRAGGASLAASRPGKLLMEMWTARITFPVATTSPKEPPLG